MSNDSQQIVNKAWNFAHVLRDDGLSYMAYTEQITFLLFLKMADEQARPPVNRKSGIPVEGPVELHVNGRACFVGSLGQRRRRLALRVTQATNNTGASSDAPRGFQGRVR